jgi:hypothetical protein
MSEPTASATERSTREMAKEDGGAGEAREAAAGIEEIL